MTVDFLIHVQHVRGDMLFDQAQDGKLGLIARSHLIAGNFQCAYHQFGRERIGFVQHIRIGQQETHALRERVQFLVALVRQAARDFIDRNFFFEIGIRDQRQGHR